MRGFSLPRGPAIPVERLALVAASLLWVGRLAYELYTAATAAAAWAALTPWAFMGACLLVVSAYIVLPARAALAVATGLAFSAAALMVPIFVAAGLDDGRWSTMIALGKYECYLAVTTAFVHLLARSKDGMVAAELEAERMRLMAYRDPLTGLPNRRALDELLDREVDHSRRTPLSLIAIDIDRFKEVNDSFGHAAGDLVLQAVAMHLQKELRTGDTVGRWGGEEFLVLCPGSGRREATELAERLRRVVERELRIEGHQVTGSFGVVQYSPGMSIDVLLERADQLMYEAKAHGRNRVVSGPAVVRPPVPRVDLTPRQRVHSAVERLDQGP